MKTRGWLWLVIVPAALGAGLFTLSRAYASPFFGGHGRHRAPVSAAEVEQHFDDKIEHLLDAVDATDAQRAQAELVGKRLAPQIFTLMDEGRALRGELKTALLAEQLDKGQISGIEGKLTLLADKLVDTGMDGLVSVADLLTPAQRRLVADKLARMHP